MDIQNKKNNNTILEYACYDEVLTENIKSNVFKAIDLGVHGISVPAAHITSLSDLIPEGMILSCPIDWPEGRSSNSLRIHAATKAIHKGANALDLVANCVLFRNGREVDFMQDIKSIKGLADDRNVTLRVMIDHRKVDDGRQFRQMVELVKCTDVEFIFCATGQYIDDIHDNLILCNMAQQDFGLNAIANASLFLPNHLKASQDTGLFGARFHKINALENCLVGV